MEAVIFVGLQGSGKSSFYRDRFSRSHVRINLDTLKTRHRERLLLLSSIQSRKAVVVDNTNATLEQRKRYILPAKAAGYRVIGYFFESRISDCLLRNHGRTGSERVPNVALFGTLKHLEPPRFDEGFESLWFVQLRKGKFLVKEWSKVPIEVLQSPWLAWRNASKKTPPCGKCEMSL